MPDLDLLDDLFHGCALAAYLDEMAAGGIWPPDSEATRKRAYRYYEEELAKKNGRKPIHAKSLTLPPKRAKIGS